jgi:hypothetical protein
VQIRGSAAFSRFIPFDWSVFELHSAAPPQMTQYTGGGILLV